MKAKRQQPLPKKAAPGANGRAPITEDQIRARAYEIYLRRNGVPGDEHSDWLQAEAELASHKLVMKQNA